jgi:hypothetical protein
MDPVVTSPTSPVPVVVERWLSRSRYLRWLDVTTAWLALAVIAASVMPRPTAGSVALASAAVLVLGTTVPALRIRWRPVSGWIGLRVSGSLRPGDRAWFVRDGRADPVLITARHGLRLSIAMPHRGEAETISVRRTRVLLVPV